jgi:hypothetical protein
MNFRVIAAAGLIFSFVAPALAADEFYIVQDVKTKKCTIVDTKPTDTSMTVVSRAGTVYKTRSEAETSMKTVKVLLIELIGRSPRRRSHGLQGTNLLRLMHLSRNVT